MSNLLAQLPGFIGLFFLVLSFQQNNRNRILIWILAGQLFFILHFVMIGAWTGVGMNIVGISRTIVFRFREERRWADLPFWPWLYPVLFMLAGVIAWEAWYSLLPSVAMSVESVGLWMKRPSRIRFINLFPHPLWFTYNVIKGSYPGMITEILVLASILVAIWRYDIRKKPEVG